MAVFGTQAAGVAGEQFGRLTERRQIEIEQPEPQAVALGGRVVRGQVVGGRLDGGGDPVHVGAGQVGRRMTPP